VSNEKPQCIYFHLWGTYHSLRYSSKGSRDDKEMMMMMMDSFPKLFEDHQLFSELKAGRKMGAFNPDYCRHPVPKLWSQDLIIITTVKGATTIMRNDIWGNKKMYHLFILQDKNTYQASPPPCLLQPSKSSH
jgi:hypothetical protein